jgi:hypothetical protein
VADILQILLGGVIGGVISPVLLEEYRSFRRERNWKRPRKELLHRLLSGNLTFRTLETLSRTVGTTPEDCRSLLVEIGARGALLRDGREAWALISRAPLKDVTDEEVIDNDEEVVAEE